ncbi:protein TIME FOR COFFEE-like [Pyrus ussuriensis x Pyrus communis]|uniref:Protein TIME FOR COFFEE-like n=1 Tax=Pyrus ussuriensis x Pyrus communis TaxID=2448454 RepID=A0A5N5F5E6_9ROSA|nr:protein TIME FOR COFFEE-like [Pyrus ussuriensis x Pyrus communis]
MKRQPQGSTKQEITATDSIKFESRETNNKFTSDTKSRVSSPISNSPCVVPQLMSPFPHNSCSFVTSMSAAGGYYKLTELSVLFISFWASSSQVALLLMIIHGIWRARNALLWENKVANPALFIKARPGPISRPLQVLMHWSPPLVGWVKVNVDGSFLSGSNVGGVVQAVGSRFQRSSPMDLLVDDIRASLRTFVDSQVCYVRRSAYGMAKLAMSFPIEFRWFEEPPDPIVEALVDVF